MKRLVRSAILLLVLICFPIVSFGEMQKMEITMFDVGAGDCFYVEMPNGNDILIDGGIKSKGQSVVKQLQQKEKNMTLEAVISTHPDSDHTGGLQVVFREMKVKKFYYPGDVEYETKTAKELIRLSKAEKDCKRIAVNSDLKLSGGNKSYLKFVQNDTDYKAANKDSLMCYIKCNKLDVLLTGDAEGGAEYKGVNEINVDILQAPHHGSKASSSAAFIRKFDPEKVLISTDGKKYGHPHQETLNRFANYDKNIKVFRTDKKGNVTIKSDGKTWTFSCKGSPIKVSTKKPASDATKIVYVTKTGSKYHFDRNCRGLANANEVFETTLSGAKADGFDLCGWED